MKIGIPRFVLGMVVVVCPALAHADDPAAAEALFKEALVHYKAGNYAEACPKFAESQGLDPRPGTLFAMAECEAAANHIATAATLYEDFLRTVAMIKNKGQQAKYLERVKMAQAQRDELLPLIPRLTLVLPAGTSPDVRITRNGETFTSTSLGVEIPVNPGEQVITVQIASGSMREQRITIGPKEKQTLVLEMPEVPALPLVEPWGPHDAPKPLPALVQEPSRPLRTAGFVVTGTGIAGIIGGVVAARAIVRDAATLEKNCVNQVCASREAADIGNNVGSLIIARDVALGAGGVATIAGAIMIGVGSRGSKDKRGNQGFQWEPFVDGSNGGVVGVKGAF